MYGIGLGAKMDLTQAYNWTALAAQQDYAFSQAVLGVMYAEGRGVKQNQVLAKEWINKSCKNGNKFGCDEKNILKF